MRLSPDVTLRRRRRAGSVGQEKAPVRQARLARVLEVHDCSWRSGRPAPPDDGEAHAVGKPVGVGVDQRTDRPAQA